MPTSYKTPGVYIEEIPKFPPSVAEVETAIPAFIGNTEKRKDAFGVDLPAATPVRIESLAQFTQYFGIGPRLAVTQIRLDAGNNFIGADLSVSHYLYDAIRLFYANGGGVCYIVSVGTGFATPVNTDIEAGITALEKFDEPTMIVMPDAVLLGTTQMYPLQQKALLQCETLKDRVTICDLKKTDPNGTEFRGATGIGINNLKYGMAYSPWLEVSLPKNVTYKEVLGTIVVKNGAAAVALKSLTTDDGLIKATAPKGIITLYEEELALVTPDPVKLADFEQQLLASFGLYKNIINGLNAVSTLIPPSGAVAGVFAYVDRTRGVWKAPANVSLNSVSRPSYAFSEAELAALNVDVTAGKSINAIRTFTGKGVLIFGARTLAGNDNEWRYVPVRRFYNMVEESVKKACEQFVFEPNDANTWVRLRGMIENFLILQWRAGALQGIKPEHAFYVSVGLGTTMTALDILEGRLIVEIGMAPVRPAEFIILRFSQKMAES